MAPPGHKMTSKTFTAKGGNTKTVRNNAQDVKKKRKWTPEHKVYEGSVQEGQGFAFKRKERARHEYNRLLRKERKRNTESTLQYKDEYPEHLRHLYQAEAVKLKQEAWTNRVNRTKLRAKGREEDKETTENYESVAEAAQHPEDAGQDPEVTGAPEPSGSVTETSDLAAAPEKEILPMSNRMKKKLQKKTSYQKSKEEFESIKEKQRKKKEEYLKNKQQREEAIQKYKQKKMETFQMLKKKTKKGQPNLNLQMDYLLQKIQGDQK